jgi:hypothetical protein
MSILHSESVASPEAIEVVAGDCHASRQGCPGEIGREETARSRQRTRRRAHGWLLFRDVRPRAFLEAAGETWPARQEPLEKGGLIFALSLNLSEARSREPAGQDGVKRLPGCVSPRMQPPLSAGVPCWDGCPHRWYTFPKREGGGDPLPHKAPGPREGGGRWILPWHSNFCVTMKMGFFAQPPKKVHFRH